MTDQDWTDVRAAIVGVFTEAAHRLRELEESLLWDTGGAMMRNGDVACWLSFWHRDAADPHIELTAEITPLTGAYGIKADIGTYEGEVLAHYRVAHDQALTVEGVAGELREFLQDNGELLRRVAGS